MSAEDVKPSEQPVGRVPCSACRPDEPCERHCGAHLRQTPGGLCKRAKGQSTDHVGIGYCDRHGGMTGNHRVAAQRVKAERAVADLAAPVDVHPHVALLGLMAMRWGEVQFWNGVVADMESLDDLKQYSTGPGREKFERASVWYEMRAAALTAAERIAKTCHDVGIDERQMRLAEEHGRTLDGVLRCSLTAAMAWFVADGVSAVRVEYFQNNVLPSIVRDALGALAFRPPEELNGGTAA